MRKITVTEIAKLANVSIGTVDRAINDREGISRKTKEKILAIAEKHHYRPNRLSKALANNKIVRIGMITLPQSIPFVQSLIQYAEAEAASLYDYGCRLTIRSLRTLDVKEEVEIINNFIDEGFDAIAIEGLNHAKIAERINFAVEQNIPVITFNSDVAQSNRDCFVGQNLHQSGKIAADILCRFMGSTGDLYVIQGYNEVAAHSERLAGFLEIVKKDFPKINIVKIEECFDDDSVAFNNTTKILEQQTNITGVYVVASGKIGAANAILDAKLDRHINFVCYDYSDEVKDLLDRNIIDATILQDPQMQGSLPVNLLFNAIFDNQKPKDKMHHTEIQIVTKHSQLAHLGDTVSPR